MKIVRTNFCFSEEDRIFWNWVGEIGFLVFGKRVGSRRSGRNFSGKPNLSRPDLSRPGDSQKYRRRRKMPFKSKAQLRTCYGSHPKGWDCDEWLDHTPSVCDLPERSYGKGRPKKARSIRKMERIVGKVQVGPRGGKFFEIEERDPTGTICVVKVYVSRGSPKKVAKK